MNTCCEESPIIVLLGKRKCEEIVGCFALAVGTPDIVGLTAIELPVLEPHRTETITVAGDTDDSGTVGRREQLLNNQIREEEMSDVVDSKLCFDAYAEFKVNTRVVCAVEYRARWGWLGQR